MKRVVVWLAGAYTLLLLIYLLLRALVGDAWWWLAFLHNFAPYYFAPLFLLLPLAMLLRLRGTAARLVPLLLFGVLLFGGRWLPDGTAQADTGGAPLQIVTFNVLPINPDFERIVDWLRTTDADVILLQELPPEKSSVMAEWLADDYPYVDDIPQTTAITLARVPFTSMAPVDLGGWWVSRVTLDHAGQAIAVYNIHMAMPTRETPHLYLSIDNGLAQLALQYDETRRNRLMRSLLDILRDETLPYIVAGDFNTSDNAVIYGELATHMTDAYRAAAVGLGGTWPASVGEEGLPAWIPPLLRIDYVWHSPHFRTRQAAIGPNLGSDHLPLLVELVRAE